MSSTIYPEKLENGTTGDHGPDDVTNFEPPVSSPSPLAEPGKSFHSLSGPSKHKGSSKGNSVRGKSVRSARLGVFNAGVESRHMKAEGDTSVSITKVALGKGLSKRRSTEIQLGELDMKGGGKNTPSGRVMASARRLSKQISYRQLNSNSPAKGSKGAFIQEPEIEHGDDQGDNNDIVFMDAALNMIMAGGGDNVTVTTTSSNQTNSNKQETKKSEQTVPETIVKEEPQLSLNTKGASGASNQAAPNQPSTQAPRTTAVEPKPAADVPPVKYVTPKYLFPMATIPVLDKRGEEIEMSQLTNIEYLISGSNSDISTAKLKGKGNVILKLMKEFPGDREVAMHEYVTEHDVLARISHNHIMGYYGGGFTNNGTHTLPFLVLERLNGGTLLALLATPPRMFQKHAISYRRAIEIGIDLADAMSYLHERFHPQAMVIHRDIKPDNVGFTDNGTLKLMDFGLSLCVYKRKSPHENYRMTGNTGSLRYMAPEVFLCHPYSEKVDLYSYGVMLWQVVTGLTPYQGMTQERFVNGVIRGGLRPPVYIEEDDENDELALPANLVEVLEKCWAHDPQKRAKMSEVLDLLKVIMKEIESKSILPKWLTRFI